MLHRGEYKSVTEKGIQYQNPTNLLGLFPDDIDDEIRLELRQPEITDSEFGVLTCHI